MKSVSLYLDQRSDKLDIKNIYILHIEITKSKRVESLPAAIYRFVESPSSLAVIYGGRLSRAQESTYIDIIRTERNIFRFRES